MLISSSCCDGFSHEDSVLRHTIAFFKSSRKVDREIYGNQNKIKHQQSQWSKQSWTLQSDNSSKEGQDLQGQKLNNCLFNARRNLSWEQKCLKE